MGMDVAVHLHAEPDLWAVEVENKRPDGRLPPKAQARAAPLAKGLPEPPLRGRRMGAKDAGEGNKRMHGGVRHHTGTPPP